MTNLPDRPDPRQMRASDTDRDRAAQVLRDAAGDGRLTLEELDERLDAVYAAKTYAELEPITRDLPAGGATPPVAGDRIGGTPGSRWSLGVLSGFTRKGRWVVPERFTAVAFWGGGKLDLRQASFAAPQVTIRVFAVMGGVSIVLPADAEVDVVGVGVMGGFDSGASGAGEPGAPRVVIKGFAFWGGVAAERRRRKRDRTAVKDGEDAGDAKDAGDGGEAGEARELH